MQKLRLPWTALVLSVTCAHAGAQCRLKLVPDDLVDNSQFGAAIDSANGRTFVGAWHDQLEGSVFVVEETAPREWTQTAKFHPGDGQSPGDQFGLTLAADGDTLVVGASRAEDNAGAAWFYEHRGAWSEVRFTAPEASVYDPKFGSAVAISGGTAVVGAAGADGRRDFSGAAYVYERSGTTWAYAAKLRAKDGRTSDWFGGAVALDGTRAVVGARGDDTPAGEDAGSAYVFERRGTVWRQMAKLTPSDAGPYDDFGTAVAVRGDRIAVSSTSTESFDGAVWVFERIGNVWTETARISSPDLNAYMGRSVDLGEDLIVAGGQWAQTFAGRAGAAYAFQYAGGEWSLLSRLVAEDGEEDDELGWAVHLDGDAVWVGARTDHDGALAGGSAYRFRLGDATASYCFGEACPCGNDDPRAGCANGSERGALLESCGSTSVADDDLVLTTTNLPWNSPAQLFMGAGRADAPFGDGLFCVSGGGTGLFRYGVEHPARLRRVSYGPGLVASSHAGFHALGHITAGQTWNFQAWYRSAEPCGSGFNMSNAVAVTFRP